MKLLFLDIDGVLNSVSCHTKTFSGYLFVEDRLIQNLKTITDATGAKIVLSSTWRIGHYDIVNGDSNSEAAIDFSMLERRLKSFRLTILDYTRLSNDMNRGGDIKDYLERWNVDKIDSFVIIDDEASGLQLYTKNLVKTEYKYGLTKEDCEKAISILNGV